MTERMLKVFISSTYRDLKEVRKLLIEGVEEALRAVAMERFVPSDESSHKKSIEYLEESDVCVFVIGDYYGTVIGKCKERADACGDCAENISYTHCEYRKALQAGKPHIVFIVENEISDVLSKVQKFDLENIHENDILRFLKRNNIDTSKAPLFSIYTLEQIEELWEIATNKNRERLKAFKKEISRSELYSQVKISKKEDYYIFSETLLRNLKEKIIEWYTRRRIRFRKFAGRRKELEEFLQKVHTEKSVCVAGTGGVGKTSLIQVGLLLEKFSGKKIYAFLKEYSYKYTRAGYLFAKGRFIEDIFSERLNLTDVLMLVFKKHNDLDNILKMGKEEQISSLAKELDRESSILFVDDLQDADEDVKEFVYRCGNNLTKGGVVAGSREEKNCFSSIGPLPGLEGEDLKELIGVLVGTYSVREYVEGNLDVWSEEIFRITQGHPMLVDIMIKNASHFSDCEELKAIKGVRDVADLKAVNEVTDRLIRDILSKEELKLLGVLSVFYLPVGKKFFSKVEDKVVNSIIDKGLLRWDKGGLGFTFEVVKELLEAGALKEYHEKAVKYYFEEMKAVSEFERPRLYVEAIYHLIKEERVEEASKLYSSVGETLERVRRRAVEVSEMLLEKTKEENRRTDILNILGNLLSVGKEFSGAEDSYMEALKITRKLAEEDPYEYDSKVAGTMNNLGNLYTDMQEFKKAKEYCIQALEIYKKLAQKDPNAYEPNVAMILDNLGNLYWNLKNFKKAEKSYMEALEIRKRLAEKDPRTQFYLATIFNNLGNLYTDMQEFKKAEEYCTQALEIYKKLAQKDPNAYEPNVAMTLNNLGNTYTNLKDFEKAEEHYCESLTIYRDLTQKDPDAYGYYTAGVLNSLGVLHHNLKEFKEAEEYYAEALEIRRKLTQECPDAYEYCTAETLNNLGTLYCDIKDFEKAEEYYTEASTIYRALARKNPGAYEPYVAITLNNLGTLYCDIRDFEKAEEYYTEALEIRRKLTQKYPHIYESNLATTLANFGNFYWNLKDFKKSEEFHAEALTIYKKLTQKYPHIYELYVAMTLCILGTLYSDLEDLKKAEESYAEALTIYKKLAQKDPDAYKYTAKTYLALAILAEELQREDAYQLYFTAGVVSFNVLMMHTLDSGVNPVNCFRKTQELSPDDSPFNKMAKIALIGISKIVNSHQPTEELGNLNVDGLPRICQALVTLLLEGETTQTEEPKSEIELMFYYIYMQLQRKE